VIDFCVVIHYFQKKVKKISKTIKCSRCGFDWGLDKIDPRVQHKIKPGEYLCHSCHSLYLQNLTKTTKYKRWRIAVFERDNYTCQKCKTKGTALDLNAHHLKMFGWYPKLRFEVNNGITLCKTCHSILHGTLKKRK
jgi:hypothetical protein